MNVTIKDIASYTGLSISTVSIVLNGKASKNRISEETAIRVKKQKKNCNISRICWQVALNEDLLIS